MTVHADGARAVEVDASIAFGVLADLLWCHVERGPIKLPCECLSTLRVEAFGDPKINDHESLFTDALVKKKIIRF